VSSTTPTIEVHYPSGDGQPMAETGIHVQAIEWLHQALQDYFQDRPDVCICADQFWYWEEGNNTARVAPDVMIVPGVGGHFRRSFFSWQESATPAVVFEMASEGTWKDDLNDKYDLYERLGVREYFLFDPEALHLIPQLQGYRLHGTAYRRMRQGAIESELGFKLDAEGMMLRLSDVRTGTPILTRAEQVRREKARVDQAQAATYAETSRADAEKSRADAEKSRADGLEAEVERLKKLLGGSPP
jgi:Uma2 family endonuclease